jgi:hypothetical protein
VSYLAQATSKLDYGVVRVGNNIVVSDGIVSVANIAAGPGITVSYQPELITVSATGADFINVYGTTTNYTATIDDEYIGVFSANAVTITLPNGIAGRVYTIKDEYGQGSGKITISPQVGEQIDGKPTYVIGVPYQSINVVFRAGSWRII